MNEAERKAERTSAQDVIVWERRTAEREEEEATVRAVPLESASAGEPPVLRIVTSGFGAAWRREAPARGAQARPNAELRMAA